MAHHQGAHSCVKQSLKLFVIASMQNCRTFISVLIIEMDMCAVIGVACRFECVHGLFVWRGYITHDKIDLGTLILVG
jgi:hypothetical protein